MLNMLPKFELDPIRMYLVTFSTVRRPSMTPSCTTPRSCSSSTRSAASLATSAALSTEMPTSAACSAEASLMPSPRKPTTRPARFSASRMRSFCCGVTRQNRLTDGSLRPQRLLAQARHVLTGQHATDRNADLGADVAGDALIVAGQDLHLDARPPPARAPRRRHRVSADRRRAQSRRRSACPRRSRAIASPSTARDAMPARDSPLRPSARSVRAAARDRAVERRARLHPGRDRRRARQDLLRRALDHEEPRRAVAEQHRDAAALEVEGHLVELLPRAGLDLTMRKNGGVERALDAAFEGAVQIGEPQHLVAVLAGLIDMSRQA